MTIDCALASRLSCVRRWIFALVLPLTLAACGGGGNFAAGGIVGTGSAPIGAVGTITGFGNDTVVLTAQEFVLTGASVSINDQPATAAALKIGMVVSVQGEQRSDGSKLARSIVYRAEARGVVDGVDTTAGTFTVLGQRVPVNSLTVFDGGTFATLVSQYVEVSGYRASPGEVVATRVDIRPTYVAGVTPLQLSGVVSSLDAISRSFSIGAQSIDFSALSAAQVPASLANGSTVQVSGTTLTPASALVATSLSSIAGTPPAPPGAALEIEGYVSDFVSVSSFKVNGQRVDATGAVADGGALDMIVNGVKLEVDGRLVNDVLVAAKIEFEEVPTLTLDGLVDSIDSAARKVSIAGQPVAMGATTQFQDLSAAAVRDFGFASIALGDRLTVRAVHAGAGLLAQRVERRDRTAPPPADPPVEVEGLITTFASLGDFTVGARRVNANSASITGGTAASLAVGVRVHVEGTLNSDVVVASRLDILPPDPAPPTDVEVRGTIDTFVSVASFHVAGQTVDATGAQFVNGTASDLANGRFVDVVGSFAAGVVHARSVEFRNVAPPVPTIEAEGLISQFVSIASFRIAGQPVDASGATFTRGRASDLQNGREAHALGPLVDGVLHATSISVEDAPDDQQVELEGRVSNFVSVSQFTVAGRTVDASAARFSHGTAADLRNGSRVHVKGPVVGAVVHASTVEFDD